MISSLLSTMLSSLLPLIVVGCIGLALAVILKRLRGAAEPRAATSLEAFEYRKKRYFFSQAERSFYLALCNATKGLPVTVMAQVRLNDLIEATGENRRAANNRIDRLHVDFVLLSQPEYQPLLAIELDGASHARAEQQVRDAKKDAVCKAAGLPLLRFQNGVLFAQLQAALEPYLNAAPGVSTEAEAIRTAVRSRGASQG